MDTTCALSDVSGVDGCHVAILEDDPLYRILVEEAVRQVDGASVVGSYGTLTEMLHSLRPGEAEVLLLDLGLPDTYGIDALPVIRARLPETNVVVLTGDESGEKLINALSQGAVGYLVKSAAPDEFSANLRAALHGESVVSQSMIKHLVGNLQQTLQELEQLTQRERETFMLVAAGQSYKQAAGVMGVSINTVRTHIRSVYRKLEVRSRAEASHKTRA